MPVFGKDGEGVDESQMGLDRHVYVAEGGSLQSHLTVRLQAVS